MHSRKVIRYPGMKPRFYKLKSTVDKRKYKESAHMACMENPISQPSLEFTPIWIPLVKEEVNTLQRRSCL
jgi:hypothetical protein